MILIRRVSSLLFFTTMGVLGAGALGCHGKESTSPSGGLDRPVDPPRAQNMGRGHDRTHPE